MKIDPVFDAHCHVGAWACADFLGHASGLDDVVRVMRAAGVTGFLAMPTDDRDNVGLLAALDARVPAEGDPDIRFAAWVDPSDEATPAFLDAHAARVAALKIHPSFSRRPVTDPGFAPYLDAAAAHGWPVVVHCGRWREVAGYELALAAAEARPDVRFVLSHMGGDSPSLVDGCARAVRERGLRNAWLGTESIREPWLVRRAVDLAGPDRVVFGSDHNLNEPAAFLAVLRATGLDPASLALVLHGNASSLFG